MIYAVNSIEQLEKLINDRTYITGLNVSIKGSFYHLLQYLTDLTSLETLNSYYRIDFSKLVNLKSLVFVAPYHYEPDLKHLVNLEHLYVCCPCSKEVDYKIDLRNCKKLKTVCNEDVTKYEVKKRLERHFIFE